MKHAGSIQQTVLTPSRSKELIDSFLTPLIDTRVDEARLISPHYETLWQDIQKLYTAGGKRFRSYMTLLTYSSYSQQPLETVLPAAAAQELLHLAMLIHDDIIDRDDVRYGVKTIAREYLDHYEEIIEDETDRRHYANSAALLAGDLLISEAYILVTETKIERSTLIQAQRLLSRAIFQVIGGELLDTEAAFRGIDAADPLLIAEQKTASYSFVSPLLMGATLAETTPDQIELLKSLGEALGIAYQLRDDIIGIFGDEEATGKSASSDILEGKKTLLIEEFYRNANETQRVTFDALFGRHTLKADELQTVRNLLIDSGAKTAVEALITSYQTHTHTIVDTLAIDDSRKTDFHALIDLCLKRDR